MIKYLSTFIFIFLSISSQAREFEINRIKFTCLSRDKCQNTKFTFNSLIKKYNSFDHFSTVLKLYASNEGIQEFYYQVVENESEHILQLQVKERIRVVKIYDVIFKGEYDFDIPTILPISEGGFLDNKKLEDTKNLILDSAKDHGFDRAIVKIKKTDEAGGVGLRIIVDLKKPTVVDNIVLSTKSNYVRKLISSKVKNFKGKPFAIQAIRTEVDELKVLLQDFGYYIGDINLKFQFKKNNKVSLYVIVKDIKRFSFYFSESEVFSIAELKNELSLEMIGSKREFTVEDIRSHITARFEEKGYHFTSVSVKKKKYLDKYKDEIIQYNIEIQPNERVVNKGVVFKGNRFFSQKDLNEFFYENSPEDVQLKFYSPTYYESFRDLLREKYIAAGFVNIVIEEPSIQFNKNTFSEYVTFRIREGNRAIVRSIKLGGVNSLERNEIYKILEVEEGKAFNPIVFKENVSQIIKFFKLSGYYFANIENRAEKDFVSYDEENSLVDINIQIDAGVKIVAGDIIIIGNKKTRKRLILREVNFTKGDIITSDKLEQSQANLLSLGIFSSVQIKPVSEGDSHSDILIFVREKDFGLFEIAPGVRSDIGFKLSTGVTYNNIDGLNKRISFQSTVNRRFDLHALDDERRKSGKHTIEYDASINYSENSIFRSNVDFTLSLSKSRKRFYSYDADIQRIGYSLSQDFTRWFNFTFRQQIEGISQYEATDDTNHGQFQIGSISPSVSFDFRDRGINPTNGALFDLTYELANPYTLSQKETDLTIDYYKLISRNKFYYSISTNWVLALSATFGVQETISDKGTNDDGDSIVRIPSIKVFRLAGADIIRGFEDDEINRLLSGNDISDVEVDNRAYMAAFKFEPRYFLSDSMILGVFYDAGRVFVDEFEMDELRSSVGMSFKYVTPVGTLDFDYGIKLLRKKDSSGTLESPGRLHVSIGFF